jgi:hypothetical protein
MHAYKQRRKNGKKAAAYFLDIAQAENLGTGFDMREMEEGLIKNTERHQKRRDYFFTK